MVQSRVTKAAALVLALCPAVLGQLNQNCTVSVLNRTVQVNADASWVLPNIPANFGQVKARATCVQGGVTTFGESAFFTIPANGAVNLPAIVLGATTPIPTSLSISSPGSPITTAGQTAQLTVTATYPNNSTRNVTAATTGTNYISSNPAIASVTVNGLVTAVSSGTVVIQASNDGASGIATVQVALGGASVGGIPVSWIIANRLDPNDPNLPFEDPDRDGLTNLQEFQIGTDPNNPDTDGDGLTDGDEVNKYRTNPLLPDTDGDLIPDGVEVTTGTNPLDPKSYDLKKATATSMLVPPSFTLSTSFANPVASVQLSWKVTLIDGKTTLNLTADPRTSYGSSNLNICSFGGQPGLVFSGSAGNCVITITQNTLSVTVPGTVQSFTPTALSFIAIPGFANNVKVKGNYAYVAAGSAGLQVVDVTDRTQPKIVSSLALAGNANDLRVVGTTVYMAAGSALLTIDVTDPLTPKLLGAVSTPGVAWDVVVSGNLAYIADGGAGLQIANVSNPASPALVGSLAIPNGTAKGVDVTGNFAVVAASSAGVVIVNITNPAAPQILGSVSTPGDARKVAVKGSAAFIADYPVSMQVVDFSTPSAPVIVAATADALGGKLQDVALSTISGRTFTLGADVFFVNGVPIVDVTQPNNPVPQAILNFSQFRDDNGHGIGVDSQYVYMTGEEGTVSDLGTTGDTRLYIGQYNQFPQDLFGIPPTAQITSPTTGPLIQGQTVTISANATDDVAVASVTLLVNGQPVFTTTTQPYQFTYTVPLTATSLTFGATAVDYGNNVGTAANVIVQVIPDPLTTATGRILTNTGTPVSGATVSALGKSATTISDGTFTLAGLPTIKGAIVVLATATASSITLSGSSAPTPPMPGGITRVGDLVVYPSTNGRFAYVADSNSNDVSAYSINAATGALTPISGSPFPTGVRPISVAVDPTGRFAYVADSNSNDVSAYSINAATGALTPISGSPFPTGVRPISVAVDPTGHFAYVADQGSQTVSAYSINAATGALTPISGSPFFTEGFPTSVAVDPTGRFAYVTNDAVSPLRLANVSAYSINAATGALIPVSGSPFPLRLGAISNPSAVAVDPTGRFAYVADPGSFAVWAYSINAATGALTPISGSPFPTGAEPFSVAVDPTGRFGYVANYGSNVSVYSINATTGALTPVSGSPFPTGAIPFSVAVDPTGRFGYVANYGSNNVSAYSINATTGALTPISGSPFITGGNPSSVTAGSVPSLPELVGLSCGQESSLKSIEALTATSIVFANTTSQSRDIYWLDYTGQRVLFSTPPSGATDIQGTYLTHPWLISDPAGNCLGIYMPVSGLARVTINQ